MQQATLNPFIAGNPVSGSAFFGREDILRQAENIFLSQGLNSVVIYGQRRIGKTSILKELQRRLRARGMKVVYMDLMDMASRPFGELLMRLAHYIARELQLSPATTKLNFDDDGLSFQNEFLPKVYQRLPADSPRLVILFDEFDVLDIVQQDQLPGTIAAKRFFGAIRQWMREESNLLFGFVLGRDLSNLDANFLATFKNGLTLQVSVLDRPAISSLINSASQVRFTPSAIDRIYALANGHPYFTQLLAKLAFDYVTNPPPGVRSRTSVDGDTIDKILPQTFSTADAVFAWIWDGLPPAERLLTSALAELLGREGAVVTYDDLLSALQSRNLRVMLDEFQTAPDRLVQLQLLTKVGDGYRFLVPLIQQWLQARKPLSEVLEERDRIDPRAQHYYELGKLEYEHKNLDSAAQHFSKALSFNPNHVKARLGLGDVLFEQGKLDEAISHYEDAFNLDDKRAAQRLGRARLERAKKTERLNEDQALADYDRTLMLIPEHQEALQRRDAFLRTIGEKAIAQKELDKASEAFSKIIGPGGDLPTGLILKNTYRIVKKLGAGKDALLYRAWDINLNLPRAMKQYLDRSPEALSRYTAEADLLLKLSHENLPKAYDFFADPAYGSVLIMDFIEGTDLRTLSERIKRLPEPAALGWLLQICEAVEYLHQQNIIHRNIKPANIIITPVGKAILVDFGLSKRFLPGKKTQTQARLKITPGFSPPEQYGQGRTDYRSDIYSIGATLYTLLTGLAPLESIQRITGQDMIPPHDIVSGISDDTEKVILQAMQLPLSERYQTIGALKADLLKSAQRFPEADLQNKPEDVLTSAQSSHAS